MYDLGAVLLLFLDHQRDFDVFSHGVVGFADGCDCRRAQREGKTGGRERRLVRKEFCLAGNFDTACSTPGSVLPGMTSTCDLKITLAPSHRHLVPREAEA